METFVPGWTQCFSLLRRQPLGLWYLWCILLCFLLNCLQGKQKLNYDNLASWLFQGCSSRPFLVFVIFELSWGPLEALARGGRSRWEKPGTAGTTAWAAGRKSPLIFVTRRLNCLDRSFEVFKDHLFPKVKEKKWKLNISFFFSSFIIDVAFVMLLAKVLELQVECSV